MRFLRELQVACAVAALWGLAQATDSRAQSYLARPVRFVIPLAPGGSADIVGRLLAQKLGERLGTSPHFAGALFNMMSGIDMVHVPYKGAAMVMTDLIGGQIHVSFASMLSAIGHAKAGRLRAVAVTGLKRSPALPELPAVAETVPGFESGSWQIIFAPAGTPAPIVTTLHREIVHVVHLPEVAAQLARDGSEPVGNSPQELAKWLPGEFAKWAKVAKAARLQVE